MKLLFAVYLALLLRLIVFRMSLPEMKLVLDSWTGEVIRQGLDRANFQPFRTIDMYVRYWSRGIRSFENLIGNILVFVPMGYLLPRIFHRAGNVLICMFCGLAVILGIELFQMVTSFGAFDVDDIILNGLGLFIGYLVFLLVRQTFCRREKSN